MDTWIVTGGAGFIGCNFVRLALAQTDARIVVVDKLTYAGNLQNLTEVSDDPRFLFVQADIAERAAVERIFQEHAPAALVNFAAARARYHLTNEWDGLMEYRWLNVDETQDSRQGALAGIYRQIGSNLRVGVGYNFTDFSDDLTDLSYESHGWVIDLVGSY